MDAPAVAPPAGPLATSGYQVHTPVFEGPFDLLLHLILRQEVDLWEVSLSTIVDSYLHEVERMQELDLEIATEFLLIAATLVELKSRRLLPGREAMEIDEELLHFEERDLLLARLLDCKTFQDAARTLERQLSEGTRRFSRAAGPEEPFRSLSPDPLERVTVAQFLAAGISALAPRESPEVQTSHIAPVRASVRDAIEVVLGLIPSAGTIGFREIALGADSRLDVIVRFLAVLELFKQGVVDLDQASTFSELVVRALDHDERADLLIAADEWDDDLDLTGRVDLDEPIDLTAPVQSSVTEAW